MNKLIICVMMCMMMFTAACCLVSATDDDYMGQQYMDIDLIETCSDDGFACDDTYSCNITITNPNQDVIVLNLPMTRNDTIYNYTLTNTDVLGIYKIKTFCGNGTFSGESIDGRLEVTTTGNTFDTLKLIIFLIVGAIILLLIGIYLRNHAIGFLAGTLFLVAGVYMMIYGFGNMADLYTRTIAVIVIGLGALFVIAAGLEWLQELD